MDARVEGMNCPIPEGRPTPPRTGSYSRRAVGASHGAERRARGGACLPRGLWTPWRGPIGIFGPNPNTPAPHGHAQP